MASKHSLWGGKEHFHPVDTDKLARRFADDLRILMYGDCDPIEQINKLADTLSEYDGVKVRNTCNQLLCLVRP